MHPEAIGPFVQGLSYPPSQSLALISDFYIDKRLICTYAKSDYNIYPLPASEGQIRKRECLEATLAIKHFKCTECFFKIQVFGIARHFP